MRIDNQTFRDLEIFECHDGSRSVFDLLNKTRTSGGEAKLRALFRQPKSRARDIVETQTT